MYTTVFIVEACELGSGGNGSHLAESDVVLPAMTTPGHISLYSATVSPTSRLTSVAVLGKVDGNLTTYAS